MVTIGVVCPLALVVGGEGVKTSFQCSCGGIRRTRVRCRDKSRIGCCSGNTVQPYGATSTETL